MIEGKNEEMSTAELSGGARIHYIFQSIFVKSLEVHIPTFMPPLLLDLGYKNYVLFICVALLPSALVYMIAACNFK